ncbi:MAG TPA: HAMP domain-containing sensor histidine kinase [Minicystis sp.]|nr:HAMP domain-containing sensor histidine kinase [Minicystis sp.]
MVALNRRKQVPAARITSRTSRIALRGAEAAERGARAPSRHAVDPRALEAERDALLAELEDVRRSGAELVSTLTHDLRNPLSVVLVSTKMMARALGPDHPSRRHIEAITRAADEINQMLQDVSDAASIERGRLAVACERQEIGPLAARAAAAVAPIAASKGLVVEHAIAGGLPDVLVEPERLVKAIQHLLVNAIRFTPRGGKVELAAAERAGAVHVWVSDTGPGLSAEARPLAFTRRGDGRRPLVQGVGLGPFVAKGIVEAHGGEVWVETEPGRGSRFGFGLPPAPPDASASVTPPA